jgi:hypothetical protein
VFVFHPSPDTVAGERTSPTQPFPVKVPPFEPQGTAEESIIDFAPELRKRAVEQLRILTTAPPTVHTPHWFET